VNAKAGGWLGGGERARRNVKWLEWPDELRKLFRHEQALRVKALGAQKATEAAWEVACRVDAWRRRGGDAKPCERCGAAVLWRVEKHKAVPVDQNGHLHACEINNSNRRR
jgi:hypothetical protein